jgi:aspartyl-tRNA(Asn)/glutamyl-tRNA(Gln) amidotransferase subunit C
MPISEEQVRHVAMLARLGLSDEQIAGLGVELNDILVQIDRIQSLDLDDIEPTTSSVRASLARPHCSTLPSSRTAPS